MDRSAFNNKAFVPWGWFGRYVLSPYWLLLALTVIQVPLCAIFIDLGRMIGGGLTFCWLWFTVCRTLSRWFAPREPMPQLSIRQLLVCTACAAIILSVLINAWPFRVRFALSESEFDTLADRVQQGDHPKMPFHAGLFVIRSVERRNGFDCFWINPEAGFGSGTGFVRSSDREYTYNLWSSLRLNKKWQFIVED